MKTKNFTLMIASILAIMFMVSAVSAAVTLIPETTSISIDSGTTKQFTFNIEADSNWNFYEIDVQKANLGPLSASDITVTTPTSINAGTNGTVTVNINVPQDATYGNYNPTLTFDGKEQNSTNSSDTRALMGSEVFTINLQINQTPSLSVTADPLTMENDENTTKVIVKNTGNVPISGIELTTSANSDEIKTMNLEKTTITSLAAGATENVTLTIDRDELENVLGTPRITIKATSSQANATGTVNVDSKFCEFSNADSSLELEIDDIEVINGIGDEEDVWYPLDEIQVTFNIENRKLEEIEDMDLIWGLYNRETNEWYVEDEESISNLDKREDTEVRVTFTLDEDIDEFKDGDYVLYAKVVGVVDDDETDYHENDTCVSTSQDITIEVEDLVIASNIKVPTSVACGMTETISAEIWNIGDSDQDDVLIRIVSQDLELNEEFEFDEIDAYDDEEVSVDFTVPTNLQEGVYKVYVEVRDEDYDLFEADNDEETQYLFPVEVKGNCQVIPKATISPTISEGGEVGEELVIKSTIVNTGSETQTFSIIAQGYSTWAELIEQDKETIVLDAGASEVVTFTFNVEDDAEGEQSFDIVATSNDGSVLTKPTDIEIQASSSLFSGLSEKGWVFWAVVVANVIVVIAIIVVLIKILASKRQA